MFFSGIRPARAKKPGGPSSASVCDADFAAIGSFGDCHYVALHVGSLPQGGDLLRINYGRIPGVG